MNLRERLQIRAMVNLILSILERIANIFAKVSPKVDSPKVEPTKPKRNRPLKKIVDTIDNIVPLPWRNRDE